MLLLTLALTLTACAALSPAAPRKTFARGTWDGNTFVSEFTELTLTLPESGWTISTDEEIADRMGISRDLLDSTTGANISLLFVNLSGDSDKDAVSLDDVADQIADGLRAADVFDYEVGETSRTTLCGNEYLLLTATYGNTTDDLLALFHD